MTKRRFTRRLALGTLSLVAALCAALLAGFYYQIYRANAAVQEVALPEQPPAAPGARILVIAPHCDDETLGVGGYMAEAARVGAHVRVVLLTNGDGFPLAATRQYLKLFPSARNYMQMAYLRQGETRAALERLGLPRDTAATFLGYPDGGLSPMWSANWSPNQPHQSPFTHQTRSPYTTSYHPQAPYCGASVVADLSAIMQEERPTEIFMPDPGDDHPDHWAAHCFATAALESIRTRADRDAAHRHTREKSPYTWARRVEVRDYLIHHGDWPVPQGLHEDARLVPPAALLHLDTRWKEVRLTASDRQRKYEAILCYRSQTAVMRRFLTSFVRQNELFGALPATELATIRPAALAPSGLPRDWGSDSVRLSDASRDGLLNRLDAAADLSGMAAAADGDRVYLRVWARAPLSPRIAYRLYAHPIDANGEVGASRTILLDPTPRGHPPVSPVTSIERQGREWRIALSRSQLGEPRRLLVGAESRVGKMVLDRLSWRVLVLPAGR